MPDAKTIIRRAKLVLLPPLLALAGCHIEHGQENPIELVTGHTVDSANWQQGSAVIEPRVEPITLVHVLAFAPGETRLDEAEIESLRNFLEQSGVHEGVRIEVDGPRLAGGYFDPVTRARVEEIREELLNLGLRSQIPAQSPTLLAKPAESIAVAVTRAMVIPPDCSAVQPEFATRPNSTWSCANAANLGYMVVDPVDLVRGQTPGPADGEAAARAIKRYREGEALAPEAESTGEK